MIKFPTGIEFLLANEGYDLRGARRFITIDDFEQIQKQFTEYNNVEEEVPKVENDSEFWETPSPLGLLIQSHLSLTSISSNGSENLHLPKSTYFLSATREHPYGFGHVTLQDLGALLFGTAMSWSDFSSRGRYEIAFPFSEERRADNIVLLGDKQRSIQLEEQTPPAKNIVAVPLFMNEELRKRAYWHAARDAIGTYDLQVSTEGLSGRLTPFANVTLTANPHMRVVVSTSHSSMNVYALDILLDDLHIQPLAMADGRTLDSYTRIERVQRILVNFSENKPFDALRFVKRIGEYTSKPDPASQEKYMTQVVLNKDRY